MKPKNKKIEVKSWIEQYKQILSGRRFDIRNNDRDYQVKDVVTFREYDNAKKEYTGNWMDVIIKYIHTGALPDLPMPGGMVVFQFLPTVVFQMPIIPKRRHDD